MGCVWIFIAASVGMSKGVHIWPMEAHSSCLFCTLDVPLYPWSIWLSVYSHFVLYTAWHVPNINHLSKNLVFFTWKWHLKTEIWLQGIITWAESTIASLPSSTFSVFNPPLSAYPTAASDMSTSNLHPLSSFTRKTPVVSV